MGYATNTRHSDAFLKRCSSCLTKGSCLLSFRSETSREFEWSWKVSTEPQRSGQVEEWRSVRFIFCPFDVKHGCCKVAMCTHSCKHSGFLGSLVSSCRVGDPSLECANHAPPQLHCACNEERTWRFDPAIFRSSAPVNRDGLMESHVHVVIYHCRCHRP